MWLSEWRMRFAPAGDNRLRVAYRWRSGNCWSEMNLETDGNSELPGEGSMEQFITEHYWGYSAQPGGDSRGIPRDTSFVESLAGWAIGI